MVYGPKFEPLSDDEWSALEQSLQAALTTETRGVLAGVFQSAHHRNAEQGMAPRTGDTVKRMRAVEAACIKLLDALDYPGNRHIASDASALLDVEPESPLPRPPAEAVAWRSLLGAARLGDHETRSLVWSIDHPERFLQDLWLWGYTARKIRSSWKDPGGRPRSVDRFVIKHVRKALEEAGVGFHYTSDPDMSGPAWEFIHHLKTIRPSVLTGTEETIDGMIRKSAGGRR